MDEGGLNVAFFADHRRENAVAENYSPISGDDYRPGNLDLPNICKTNRAAEVPGEGSLDFWEDGTVYPSDADKFWYYMGYAHTVDWVRVTVDVKQAGKYNVSSNWACANPKCGLSIWFNDGTTPSDNPDRPMDGQNKSGVIELDGTNDYHKWRAYPNFAQVDLSAGLQLMTFNLEVADHLQYGFLQFDLVGGNPIGGGGAGGAAGGSGTAGAPAGGSGSASGGEATGGAPNGGAPGSVTPTAGTTAVTPSGGNAPALTSGSSTEQGSSCGMSKHTRDGDPSALLSALALALARLGRRRRAQTG